MSLRIGLSLLFLAIAGLGAWLVLGSDPGPSGVWFQEVTSAAGIDFRHHSGRTGRHRYLEVVGGGAALFDYDGDGFLDLYFVNGNHVGRVPDPTIRNVLYRNRGDGTFEDVTAKAGVGDHQYGQGCCAADYDHDGDVDLYVSNYGPDRFYRNNGDGTFTDVAKEVGVACDLFGQAVAFFDADGDGWLDLYVQNYLAKNPDLDGRSPMSRREYSSPDVFPGAPDRLYRNKGDGTFEDVTKAAGLFRPNGKGMGIACVDFDGDGDLDVFIANDGMENYYFANRGDGTFEERSVASGLAYNWQGESESSMGVDVGDFNGDGTQDLCVPALRVECCTLYKNRAGSFDDVSRATGLAGVTRPYTGFSPNFGDFDHDGDLDLFLANGGVNANRGVGPERSYLERYGQADLLLRNVGDGRFQRLGAEAGPYFAKALIGRGSASGDLDNDGDLDLVICNLDGPPVLLRNDAPKAGAWVTLDLRAKVPGMPGAGGKASYREAIGAVVRLTAGGRTQVKVVRASGGYLTLNDRRLHFGLGPATSVDRVEITWADGSVQVLEQLPLRRVRLLRQE